MRYGELFAGISGFGLGFEQAGMECAWRVEIDPNCQAVLRTRYPGDLLLSDVRECGNQNLSVVDVICFGSPCQDLSVAGKRGGLSGKRSGLFFEAIRICDELRPAFAVWENVPGALSSNAGRDFAAVLGSFRDIGASDIAWTILDAQYFGLAQRRKRVFLVADFRGERAAEILFESASLYGDSPPRREARARVAGLAATSPTLGVSNFKPTKSTSGAQIDFCIPDVAWALQERDAKGADSDTKDGHLLVMPILEAGARTNGDGYRDGDGIGEPGDPMFTLQRGKQHAVAATLWSNGDAHSGFQLGDGLIAATLNSGGNSGGFRTEPGEHLVTHALSSEGAEKIQENGRPVEDKDSDSPEVSGLQRSGERAGAVWQALHESEAGESASSNRSRGVSNYGVRRLTPL